MCDLFQYRLIYQRLDLTAAAIQEVAGIGGLVGGIFEKRDVVGPFSD
jgi:hypothetical protein